MNIKIGKIVLRSLFLIILIIPVIYFREFYTHFYSYLTGNILGKVITGQWSVVLLNIALFTAFLIPLSFRRKTDWREYGLVSAFFISLFIEMYGIPLTILFASKFFNPVSSNSLPPDFVEFKVLGIGFGMDLPMVYGLSLMVLGSLFIFTGWVTLYRNIKKSDLVTVGIYSYSRHPQYLGFILIILGWFVGWPTILTSIFAPLLIYKYLRLCKTEEKELSKLPEYSTYLNNVPFLF